jgi:hypothetical protein
MSSGVIGATLPWRNFNSDFMHSSIIDTRQLAIRSPGDIA